MKNLKRILYYAVSIAVLIIASAYIFLIIFSYRAPDHTPETRRLSDVRQLASGLELYKNDFQKYPATLLELVPNYIGKLPSPKKSNPGSACKNPEDELYRYTLLSSTTFELKFCLGKDTGGYKKGTRVLTEDGIK